MHDALRFVDPTTEEYKATLTGQLLKLAETCRLVPNSQQKQG